MLQFIKIMISIKKDSYELLFKCDCDPMLHPIITPDKKALLRWDCKENHSFE